MIWQFKSIQSKWIISSLHNVFFILCSLIIHVWTTHVIMVFGVCLIMIKFNCELEKDLESVSFIFLYYICLYTTILNADWLKPYICMQHDGFMNECVKTKISFNICLYQSGWAPELFLLLSFSIQSIVVVVVLRIPGRWRLTSLTKTASCTATLKVKTTENSLL